MSDNCPVCQTTLNDKIATRNLAFSAYAYDCPRCGKFVFMFRESDLERFLNYGQEKQKTLVLSHNIRKMQKGHSEVVLNGDLVKAILKKELPGLTEQINNIIFWMGQSASHGEKVNITVTTHLAIMGAINSDGFGFVLQHLKDQGLIEGTLVWDRLRCEIEATLSFAGWEYYRELERGSIDSRKAFMAMKYGDPELDIIVDNHFKQAVADTGFELVRLDEEPKAGLIDDRLRVEIRNSRFLISDLTHDNSGAYWEAGYAEGLGKPVIYTCKKEKFEKDKPHFDTNHHLTVIWNAEEIKKAVESLKATIRATLPAEARLSDNNRK